MTNAETDVTALAPRPQRADARRNYEKLVAAGARGVRRGRHVGLARGHRPPRAGRHRHALSPLPDAPGTCSRPSTSTRSRRSAGRPPSSPTWRPGRRSRVAAPVRRLRRHQARTGRRSCSRPSTPTPRSSGPAGGDLDAPATSCSGAPRRRAPCAPTPASSTSRACSAASRRSTPTPSRSSRILDIVLDGSALPAARRLTPSRVAAARPSRCGRSSSATALWVSPMCQYSSRDGAPTDWHLVHLGARATGGAGAVIVEASAVVPEGRISPDDSGIWSDRAGRGLPADHGVPRRARRGARHPDRPRRRARRRSSAAWRGGRPLAAGRGRLATVGPSALAYDDGWQVAARALTASRDRAAWSRRSRRPRGARSRPASACSRCTPRTATCCTSSSRRSPTRAAIATAATSRGASGCCSRSWRRCARPGRPSCRCRSRISASDWVGRRLVARGLGRARAALFGPLGVDLVDCSSGGNSPAQQIPLGPGYQVPFAAAIRREAGIATAAVGLITEPLQAEEILPRATPT